MGSGADDEDERSELRRARKQRENKAADGMEDTRVEEPVPDAEQTPIGRKIIQWLTQNDIRAKKGPLADWLVEALTETSLTHPGKDNGKAWLDALSSMPDEHIFLLKLEAKTEKEKFERKVKRSENARALKKLHESGKLKLVVGMYDADPTKRSASRARQHWLQLRMAVRLGGFVTKFVDGSRDNQLQQQRAIQEEEEAAEARMALDRETREADIAVAKAQAAEEAALEELDLLDKEQVDLENARRVLASREVEAANARAAVIAAENALTNPAGSIMLLRLGGLKNADRDGASDPLVKVFWNDECIHESKVYQNDNAPEMLEKVTIDSISSLEPDTLRCEVWDYDPVGEGEFLGQYQISGKAVEGGDDGEVTATSLLPSGARKFQLTASTHGHAGAFVGGFISLGQFELYSDQAKKDLINAQKVERKTSEALHHAAEIAAREKTEADEQRVCPKSFSFPAIFVPEPHYNCVAFTAARSLRLTALLAPSAWPQAVLVDQQERAAAMAADAQKELVRSTPWHQQACRWSNYTGHLKLRMCASY